MEVHERPGIIKLILMAIRRGGERARSPQPRKAATPGSRSARNQRLLRGRLSARTRELTTRTGELTTRTGELTARTGELTARTGELTARTGELTTQQQAASRLVDILEATTDLVAIIDVRGRPLYLNRSGRQLLGLAADADLSGMGPSEIFPEPVWQMIMRDAVPVAMERGAWSGEATIIGNGREIPVSQVILVHRAPDGTPSHFSTIARDISDRKRAEGALRQSEERFRSVFEHSAVGKALMTMEGKYVQVNRAFCQMLGRTPEQLAEVSFADVTHPDEVDQHLEYLRSLLIGAVAVVNLEKRYIHRDGHVVWAQVTASLLRDPFGAPLYLVTEASDITEHKRFEQQLLYLANHDSLTRLYNRARFQEEVDRQLALLRRYGTAGVIAFLDLDNFKDINDSLGHRSGDEVLVGIGRVLREQLRETDIVARLGGDEFAVLLPQSDAGQAREVCSRLAHALAQPLVLTGGHAVRLTASIGLALFPEHGTTSGDLLARADAAMYRAKESGGNQWAIHDVTEDWEARVAARRTWEHRIRESLEQDRFVLYAQPILDLHSGTVTRYEILLRMLGEGGETVLPTAFLDVAERVGLIREIDRWVVSRSIRLLAEHQRAGRELCLEVNLSGRAFADPDLLVLIQHELLEHAVDPARLVLEITETAAIANIGEACRFIDTLKGLGCRFALDDFGMGYSSFRHLKYLPVDYLKIDGSFIQDLKTDRADQHMVAAIVEVARGLGKQTIAEFVGDAETLELIRGFGVDFAQGFHVGRPLPVAELWPGTSADA
jgi:diguanylate cyclase (GGDEF)-like protein/PAS domain S-box-containing protein